MLKTGNKSPKLWTKQLYKPRILQQICQHLGHGDSPRDQKPNPILLLSATIINLSSFTVRKLMVLEWGRVCRQGAESSVMVLALSWFPESSIRH